VRSLVICFQAAWYVAQCLNSTIRSQLYAFSSNFVHFFFMYDIRHGFLKRSYLIVTIFTFDHS